MSKKPPHTTCTYSGEYPAPETLALLRELGFLHVAGGIYRHPDPAWALSLLGQGWQFSKWTNKAPLFRDNVETKLRAAGFPIDAILRTKRLNALLGA